MKPNQQPRTINRKKRLGRGTSSGRGDSSGRGTKGQRSRAGHNIPTGFEGGQTPIKKRIPKLGGFHRQSKQKVEIVNLKILDRVFKSGQLVSPKTLFEKGLIDNQTAKVKILADGRLNKRLKFEGCFFSKAAKTLTKDKKEKKNQKKK